jgi:thiol-disulfide isomerase/thioredoxin
MLVCVIAVVILGVFSPVHADRPAQDDPAAKLEALAIRTYAHNALSGDFTVINGADLGTVIELKPTLEQGSIWDASWTLSGLGEGQEDFSLADIERPTLINLWASWCGPCRMEFPLLLEVALNPDDHAYDVVFVNTLDEGADVAEATVQSELARMTDDASGLRFLFDANDTLMEEVGSLGIPTSILVDTDGTVLALQVGNFTSVQAAMFEIIAQNPDISVGPLDTDSITPPDQFVEFQPFEAADAAPIVYGDEVSGTIDSENVQQVYSFEGRKGDVVSVVMDAELLPHGDAAGDQLDVSTLEPYVLLLGPDGDVVAESSDFLYEVFAQVADVTLPADGVYTVVATRYMNVDGISAGNYTLTVTQH